MPERLVVEIDADIRKLNKELNKARAIAERTSGRMAKSFGKFDRRMKSVTRSVFSFRKAMVAAAAITAIGFMIKRSLDAADAIGKTADSIGISTDALQEYRFAAQIAGVETSALDGAFQAAAKRFGELRQGTGTLVTILNKMDVELKNNIISAETTGEALDLVFDAMGKLTNQTDRAALSSATFGRTAGVKMTNLLKDGSKGLAELREEARRLGVVLEEKAIRQAEATNDAITRLTAVIGKRFTAAVLLAAPAIETMADAITESMPDLIKFTSGMFNATRATLIFFGAMEGTRLEKLDKELAGLNKRLIDIKAALESAAAGRTGRNRSQARELMEAEFKAQQRIIEVLRQRNAVYEGLIRNKKALKKVALAEVGARTGAVPGALEPAKALKEQAEAVKAVARLAAELHKADQKRFLDKMGRIREEAGAVKSAFQQRESGILLQQKNEAILAEARNRNFFDLKKNILDTSDLAQDLGFTFASAFEDAIVAGNELSDVLRGLAQDILRIAVRRAINPIAEGLSSLIGAGLGSIFGAPAAPSPIPLLAHGGPVAARQPVIVGERGPEPFIPKMPGTILPNDFMKRGPAVTNIFQVDMRGASVGAVQRLEALVLSVNGSIENRAVSAVADARARGVLES